MFGEGDGWLAVIFAPHRLAQTIREMEAAQAPAATGPAEPVRAETSSTSCGQAIFVDRATGASLSSDAVLLMIGRLW